jgi:hypothetical protein
MIKGLININNDFLEKVKMIVSALGSRICAG